MTLSPSREAVQAAREQFVQALAAALDDLYVNGPKGHFGRVMLREYFAPKVADAIDTAVAHGMWCSATHGHAPMMERAYAAVLAVLARSQEPHKETR